MHDVAWYSRSCPAKINLWLSVVGRRADGYHDLQTVMEPISLADELRLRVLPATGAARVTVRCPALPDLPAERNLVYRAAAALLERSAGLGNPPPAVEFEFELKKHIPHGAGLGGGSSDAAAALRLLNDHLSTPLPATELFTVARTIGADVPFFLHCRLCYAEGIGDRIMPLDDPIPRWYLLLKPPVNIETGWAYSQLRVNNKLTNRKLHINMRQFFQPGFLGKKYSLFNDFEAVVGRSVPGLQLMRAWLEARREHAGVLMSGSGSCLFAVFHSAAAASRAYTEAAGGWRSSSVWFKTARNLC
ncbi:MAG: 4-(cytidine 5'-diphospho)-2-C-methyl-D-erythritol kinase [Deltaproteobacteria bacterium]|nr:4-(cytidine 5'-diphospho)-2-C-methyl-D-erythritol kinase [Candidatus Anaeroferrophillacea bacterium]